MESAVMNQKSKDKAYARRLLIGGLALLLIGIVVFIPSLGPKIFVAPLARLSPWA